jgi:Uncharacterized protein conserved in bacteria
MKEIKIYKDERKLEFWQDDTRKKSFKISLGFSPRGKKVRDGDGRTPEGRYYICTKNEQSKFTLFLGLSYPNTDDAAKGLAGGLITSDEYEKIASAIAAGKRPDWETALGGKIGIHGMGTSRDWTAGCVAMEDEDIKWLWDHTEIGDTVDIFE